VAFSSLAYGGLFAFISGSSFVLQGHYGLPELPYAFSFAFVVLGFMAGTTLAQRLVPRRGLDGTIGAGVAALAAGGVVMLVLVLAGVPSSLAVTLPMTLYAMGVGLTMPQSMASAMGPFPERAGAASSLLGMCQMTFAAGLGIALGHSLDGGGALPLPVAIAGVGLVALVLSTPPRASERANGTRLVPCPERLRVPRARKADSRKFLSLRGGGVPANRPRRWA
jgi:DHA1 family bicyclomycin/chloramphenicol resistance-like MFS transporter